VSTNERLNPSAEVERGRLDIRTSDFGSEEPTRKSEDYLLLAMLRLSAGAAEGCTRILGTLRSTIPEMKKPDTLVGLLRHINPSPLHLPLVGVAPHQEPFSSDDTYRANFETPRITQQLRLPTFDYSKLDPYAWPRSR
jgi:hypothetical protein